jgi:KUP system potassium uptake protein
LLRKPAVDSPDSGAPKSTLALSVAAVGVVFGDIGTSPLYALRACFSDVAGVEVAPASVLGVLSLIFWSLALVISVKYVVIILRADNKGEGGVLALTTLVLTERPLSARAVGTLGLIGCALFYGDGVITPAITVLGAMEGLHVVTPAFDRAVLPLSVIALLWLFALQKRGTGAIGRLFGPLMVVWFLALASLGIDAIVREPLVLAALNPAYAGAFFVEHAIVAFAVFGAVFLVVTGGEALYADLGHFGRQPIAQAWFYLVWPCLVLNYFGQGALLLESPEAIANPFFLLAPAWGLVPLLLLATAASIIASQAVISGVFSLAQQCQQLGFIPRLRVLHSSAATIGQVYVPVVNWIVCIATLAVTIGFGSSQRVAHAYGVGVSLIMLISTMLIMMLLASRHDRPARVQFAALGVLALVDVAFVLANLGKIGTGGWFALLFGALVFALMRTWQRGREVATAKMRLEERPEQAFLASLQKDSPVRVEGTAVFLTSNTSGIPRTLVRNLKMNGVLHEQTIIFSLCVERVPRIMRGGRVQVRPIDAGLTRVIAHIGFMELPDVPKLLKEAKRVAPELQIDDAIYFLGRDDLVVGAAPRGMARWRKRLFVFLARNSLFAAAGFGLPPARVMEVSGQVEI